MNPYKNKPEPFFELVVHDESRQPGLTGASAGYELGKFRNSGFAEYLFDWLPEFALKYSEIEEFNSGTAMRLVKQAAKTVYTTGKYQKRGEFGEILLHALLREVFNSEPAISKIYYKSSTNETVKGFDAVHIVENGDALELWLGEVKFYKDADRAVKEITEEIANHTEQQYLRNEFILIGSKLDPRWKHTDTVRELISRNKSLDQVFRRLARPFGSGSSDRPTGSPAQRLNALQTLSQIRDFRKTALMRCKSSIDNLHSSLVNVYAPVAQLDRATVS